MCIPYIPIWTRFAAIRSERIMLYARAARAKQMFQRINVSYTVTRLCRNGVLSRRLLLNSSHPSLASLYSNATIILWAARDRRGCNSRPTSMRQSCARQSRSAAKGVVTRGSRSFSLVILAWVEGFKVDYWIEVNTSTIASLSLLFTNNSGTVLPAERS